RSERRVPDLLRGAVAPGVGDGVAQEEHVEAAFPGLLDEDLVPFEPAAGFGQRDGSGVILHQGEQDGERGDLHEIPVMLARAEGPVKVLLRRYISRSTSNQSGMNMLIALALLQGPATDYTDAMKKGAAKFTGKEGV